MNKDIRVSTTFPTHPKTIKLRRRLGAQGVDSLISLWAFAGEYRSKGILYHMADEDIAIAARWEGEAQEFVNTLVDIGFLDNEDGEKSIHDWVEHNAYAYYSDERREQAIQAARIRWDNDKDAPRIATSTARSYAPSPSPIPSPKKDVHISRKFESIWKDYPRPIGQKLARKHFIASVKTDKDYTDIQKALENYKASENVQNGYVQNGSTWFNNWRDWINYREPQKQDRALEKSRKRSDALTRKNDELKRKQREVGREREKKKGPLGLSKAVKDIVSRISTTKGEVQRT